jgi:hypothetical protein
MFIIVALLCLAHTIAALQVGSVEFYVSTMPGKYESCQIALAEQTKGCTVDNKNLYDVRFELKKNAHQLHSVNKQLAEFSQSISTLIRIIFFFRVRILSYKKILCNMDFR